VVSYTDDNVTSYNSTVGILEKRLKLVHVESSSNISQEISDRAYESVLPKGSKLKKVEESLSMNASDPVHLAKKRSAFYKKVKNSSANLLFPTKTKGTFPYTLL